MGLLMVALRSQGNWRLEGTLGTPVGLVHWKRTSSPVEAGTSGFLSISDSVRRIPADMGQEGQAWSWVEVWNTSCLSRCSRGERLLVELYLEPGVFSRRCKGESLPLRVVFIHRVELEGLSRHRVLIKSGPCTRGPSECGNTHKATLEFCLETGLILRCDRKFGNPFQTKQGSRPSCRDQEGRRGSEEVVLENLGVPLEGHRYVGEL